MKSDRERRLKEWWGRQIAARPVWRSADLPDAGFGRDLRALALAQPLGRSVVLLGRPGEDLESLLRARFWETVAAVLAGYDPYAIGAVAALRLWSQDSSMPRRVEVWTRASSARVRIGAASTLRLEKRPDLFAEPAARIVSMPIGGKYALRVESAESLLTGLRPAWMRDAPDLVSSFLKAARFDRGRLAALAAEEAKPAKLARLALMLRSLGRGEEARAVEEGLLAGLPPTRSVPKVSLAARLPEAVRSRAALADPPYAARFRDQLRLYAETARERLGRREDGGLALADVLDRARRSRQYDAYHSTTIEGYRVTPEEIAALVVGAPPPQGAASPETIERRMALKGYLDAHDYALERIEAEFESAAAFRESFVRELYARLFSPAVEAGLVDAGELVRYRNHPVFLRGSRFVPPNDAKVGLLMSCLIEELARMEPSPARAALAHFGFVTVHPYRDGNGRLGRFLMNYLLCVRGFPWVTIRADDRDAYFRSLETAQVDGNFGPFADFIARYLGEAGG